MCATVCALGWKFTDGKIMEGQFEEVEACIFQGSFPNVELPSLMFLTSENPVLEGKVSGPVR